MKRGGYMYMMMNKNNTVIYTGVTLPIKKARVGSQKQTLSRQLYRPL